ncbi:hypothetical protein DFH08DRAFT_806136 [Mycena albidolilacea]|uniref:Uncharacterized protein n=1 Tax=Mycena albidolilacea TaxID=1033008 RepID=A0AAD7A7P7_9AGAR|nr:hypothetical protein DFH08DRAFT_806136 [Mycena albidolilacea]
MDVGNAGAGATSAGGSTFNTDSYSGRFFKEFYFYTDLTTSSGTNIYGLSWMGPPYATFSGYNQTTALAAFIGAIRLDGPDSSSDSISQSPDSTPSKNSTTYFTPIVGGILGGIAVVALAGVLLWCVRRRRRHSSVDDEQLEQLSALLQPFFISPRDEHGASNMASAGSLSASVSLASSLPRYNAYPAAASTSPAHSETQGQKPSPTVTSELFPAGGTLPSSSHSIAAPSGKGGLLRQQFAPPNSNPLSNPGTTDAPNDLPTEQLVQILNRQLQNRQWGAEGHPSILLDLDTSS